MKIYEEYDIPASKSQRCTKRKCDLCGKESKSSEWDSATYGENDETEISMCVKYKHSQYYGDSGETNEYEIDLCPKCFVDKLVPALKLLGADIKEKETWW